MWWRDVVFMFLTCFYNSLGHWGNILSCYIHFFLEFSRFFAAIMDFMAAIMDFEKKKIPKSKTTSYLLSNEPELTSQLLVELKLLTWEWGMHFVFIFRNYFEIICLWKWSILCLWHSLARPLLVITPYIWVNAMEGCCNLCFWPVFTIV